MDIVWNYTLRAGMGYRMVLEKSWVSAKFGESRNLSITNLRR